MNIEEKHQLDTRDFKLLTDAMLDLKATINRLDDKISTIIDDTSEVNARLSVVENNCRRRENVSREINNKLVALELGANRSVTKLDASWTVVKIVATGAVTFLMTMLAIAQAWRK